MIAIDIAIFLFLHIYNHIGITTLSFLCIFTIAQIINFVNNIFTVKVFTRKIFYDIMPLKLERSDTLSQNQENFKRGCAELLALYLLSKEDLYGYQITQLMEEKSDGRFTMLEGTLYLILYKLVDVGYLSTYSKLVGKRRTRKYYHLEDSGREYLNRILKEYDEVTKGITLILDREVD